MPTITAEEAGCNIHQWIDETLASRQPIVIQGKHGNAVLISQEEWSSIQETIYLLSSPVMARRLRESIESFQKGTGKEHALIEVE